ncbi:hypothetical protein L218DRAFT_948288 [Marasmius fiardii PR-910]|nr:hypothetical protein L218DRAFT_948288 [Marasmius fiardii PR-910]
MATFAVVLVMMKYFSQISTAVAAFTQVDQAALEKSLRSLFELDLQVKVIGIINIVLTSKLPFGWFINIATAPVQKRVTSHSIQLEIDKPAILFRKYCYQCLVNTINRIIYISKEVRDFSATSARKMYQTVISATMYKHSKVFWVKEVVFIFAQEYLIPLGTKEKTMKLL